MVVAGNAQVAVTVVIDQITSMAGSGIFTMDNSKTIFYQPNNDICKSIIRFSGVDVFKTVC